MNSLTTFWTWAYGIGLTLFALLVVVIIPLGARDLKRLLKDLNQRDQDE